MLIPMLVMPFEQFKAQGRIFKSTKAWREEAFEKKWLEEYDESSGKVVIFISHTCAAPSHHITTASLRPPRHLCPSSDLRALSLALIPVLPRTLR